MRSPTQAVGPGNNNNNNNNAPTSAPSGEEAAAAANNTQSGTMVNQVASVTKGTRDQSPVPAASIYLQTIDFLLRVRALPVCFHFLAFYSLYSFIYLVRVNMKYHYIYTE